MKFVFDECVSHKIANALSALGVDAEPYFKHWQRGEKDIVWIPHACRRDWCIVTSDRFRPHEREALKQHKARVIVLATASLGFWAQVCLVINRWEDICRLAERERPPFIFRFTSRSRKPERINV